MKYSIFIYLITLIFVFTNLVNSNNENNNCEFIKQELSSPPKSIYISLSSSNNNNDKFINFIELKNNTKSNQIFQLKNNYTNNSNIEFLTILSNNSILIKFSEEYFNEIGSNNTILNSFTNKWDYNKLYQIYYINDNCSNSSSLIVAMVLSGNNNFTILIDNILTNVNNNNTKFQIESNIKTNENDFKFFKSLIDLLNKIHYSLIYDINNNIYLIITNLVTYTNKSYLIKYSNNNNNNSTLLFEFQNIGISVYNNSIILSYSELNSTLLYSINLNNSSNIINLKDNEIKFEILNFKVSNFIRSINSKYFIMYDIEKLKMVIYNLELKEIQVYENIQIGINEYSINDLYSSSFNEPVINNINYNSNNTNNNNSTKITNSSNDNDTSNNHDHTETKIILSIVITIGGLSIIGIALFLILKKIKKNSRRSFKKLDKDKEILKYPADNITILLDNYK